MSKPAGGATGATDAAAALSVRASLGEALRLYRRHWKLLTPIAVAVLLPQAVVDTAFGGIELERVTSFGDVLTLAAIPFTVVISLAGEALLAGVITAIVLYWRLGHRPPDVRTFIRTLPWLGLIAVDLLLAIGTAIGLLLLVLPGLFFLTYFSIAPALVEIERNGVVDALRRSASLVRGHLRQVFVLIVGLIVITEGAAQALLALFHGFLPEFASEIAIDGMLESIQGLVIALLAISLIRLRGDPVHERVRDRPVLGRGRE